MSRARWPSVVLLLALASAPAGAADIMAGKTSLTLRGAGDPAQALKDGIHADAAALAELEAEERAAVDAVKNDKRLTPLQRRDKVWDLRSEFKKRRKVLRHSSP